MKTRIESIEFSIHLGYSHIRKAGVPLHPRQNTLAQRWNQQAINISQRTDAVLLYAGYIPLEQTDEAERVSRFSSLLGDRFLYLPPKFDPITDIPLPPENGVALSMLKERGFRIDVKQLRGDSWGELLEVCVRRLGDILKNQIGILDSNYGLYQHLSLTSDEYDGIETWRSDEFGNPSDKYGRT